MDRSSLTATLTRRDALRLGVAGAVTLGAAACSGGAATNSSATAAPAAPTASGTSAPGLEELASKAKTEGSLVYYSAAPQNALDRLGQAFTAKYGIPVAITRLVSSPLAARFSAEAQSGQMVADVVQMSDNIFMNKAADQGWLAKLDPASIASVRSWPAAFIQKDMVVLQAFSTLSLAYNTQLVKGSDVPTKWEDLLNPKWKGTIMMPDPRSVIVTLAWVYFMRQTFGDGFVKQLGAQQPKLTESTTTGINSVASGDVAMLAPSNHWSNTPLIEQGAPIDDAYPAPTTGTEQWMGMVKNPPHPNAALLFMNYALSQEGQSAECTNLCTVVTGAPGAIPLPPGYVSPPLDAADAQKGELLALLGIQ